MLLIEELLAASSEERLYAEDVFATILYTGNGSTQTITNGIDLAGKGGLVWIRSRDQVTNHHLEDTVRGFGSGTSRLSTNLTSAAAAGYLSAPSSTGYSVTYGGVVNVNQSAVTYASWTFRRAPKFFDVVTWTGNGVTSGRQIPHSLGAVPAVIIVKRTDTTSDWTVSFAAQNAYFRLNTTDQAHTATNQANMTNGFTQGEAAIFRVYPGATGLSAVNETGGTYVAYLFAHDPSPTGLIQCGSFTTDASGNATVTLGWEPQFILCKSTTTNNDGGWTLHDTMRGMSDAADGLLYPNANNAEITATASNIFVPTATGFRVKTYKVVGVEYAGTFVYVAIRRPMKPPTAGTQVFLPVTWTGDNTSSRKIAATITPDLCVLHGRSGAAKVAHPTFVDRLRGDNKLLTTDANAASLVTTAEGWTAGTRTGLDQSSVTVSNDSWNPTTGFLSFNGTGFNYAGWLFSRAPGFFDIVTWTGDSVDPRAIPHNLGQVPRMIITKARNVTSDWGVYHAALAVDTAMYLNSTGAVFNSGMFRALPTETTFTVGNFTATNISGNTYVAYLFGDVPGVSKVGTYSGSASAVTVACGFPARFVLIKRTDVAGGNWYIYDTARGITQGANDPFLFLDNSNSEITTTNRMDPHASGFIVNTGNISLNTTGGSYIFLAIG